MISTTALRVGVGLRKLGHHDVRLVQARQVHKGNLAATWVNKVLDNPLPLGVGALVVGLLQLRRIREREERKAASNVEEEVKIAEEWKVNILPALIELKFKKSSRFHATSLCPCDTFREHGAQ